MNFNAVIDAIMTKMEREEKEFVIDIGSLGGDYSLVEAIQDTITEMGYKSKITKDKKSLLIERK